MDSEETEDSSIAEDNIVYFNSYAQEQKKVGEKTPVERTSVKPMPNLSDDKVVVFNSHARGHEVEISEEEKRMEALLEKYGITDEKITRVARRYIETEILGR